VPLHRRGHVEADIRVHYASRNAAHRGSRRIRADHDEHSHGWEAFRGTSSSPG
jgi:hypothetical protein